MASPAWTSQRLPRFLISPAADSRSSLHRTFSTYINEKRVTLAREPLSTRSDMTVLVVSLECGFNTISNFNTTFRKMTGMSPTEYRKKRVG